jgi:hypothetical protein
LHKITLMAKFLILHSSNKGNIGIIKDYSDTFDSPEVMKLTDEQVEEWSAISHIERKLRLEEYRATNDKKKIFQNVEGAIKQIEKESVEYAINKHSIDYTSVGDVTIETVTPEIEKEKPINNPVNEKPKSKGRPKKVN